MTNKNSEVANWPPAEPSHNFPDFVKNRVDNFFTERVQNTWAGGHIMRGQIPDKNAIQVANNDYLSLGNHPEIIEAQVKSLLSNGNGEMKGTVFLHGDNVFREFELQMAQFLQSEDVLLSQSGWCANTGLIQSIADETVPVYLDMFAHMSLWEGVKIAGAKAHPFRHNDASHLRRLVNQHGAGIIIVDSVYSTNGDICPLEEMVDIAEATGCVIVVDESHSLGTHGPNGEGMVVSMGLADKVHFRTSSMAKAFPGRGGIIACSSRHREYLLCESRPAIFSSALLPHDVYAYLAMIKIVRRESWRRTKLHRNADFIREELDKMGYNLEASKSQIISLESGTEQQTIILRDALESNGIFASVFCAPATPKNRALMRMSINANLSQEEVEKIVKVCYDIREKVDMKNWASTLRKERDQRKARMAANKLITHSSNAAVRKVDKQNNIYKLSRSQKFANLLELAN